MGKERRYIFHLSTRQQLSSLSLHYVNQHAVCYELSGKKEPLFITRSLTPQKAPYSLQTCIYREERAKPDSTKKVQFSFSFFQRSEYRLVKGKGRVAPRTYLSVA